MIELVDISKKFKDVTILENVNLVFEDGKRYYLKGINGSGKSVLLKLIVGYLKPNSGYVAIDGEKLGNKNEFIKDAGVFINSPEFLDSLTGLQNLEYLGKIRRRVDTGYRDHLIERLIMSMLFSPKRIDLISPIWAELFSPFLVNFTWPMFLFFHSF